LILTLFETGLRASEALSLTPRSIGQYDGKPVHYIKGNGKKQGYLPAQNSLAHRLKSYAYTKELGLDDRTFNINQQGISGLIPAY